MWNDSDAMKLFNANLPVFYIRPYNAFDQQVISSVVPLSPPQICMVTASPPYPILLSSCQAGSDEKFAAIRSAAISCFDVQSPFENMHLPGAYASSFSISQSHKQICSPGVSVPSTSSLTGVVRTSSSFTRAGPYPKSHKAPQQAKKHSRARGSDLPTQSQPSRFEDLAVQSPLLPPLLPSCRGINATINIRHSGILHDTAQPPKLTTVVPDPALIFGSPDEEKRLLYLKQWCHVRDAWLSYCRESSSPAEPVSGTIWKKILSLPSIGPWKTEKPVKSKQDSDHQAATQLLETVFTRHRPNSSIISSMNSVTISTSEAKRLVRELTFINFRHQLLSLDAVVDQTAPEPNASITAVELKVLVANHRRNRKGVVNAIFGNGGDVFTWSDVTLRTGFVADSWAHRVGALRSFWRLMSDWPVDKSGIWNCGLDPNLPHLVGPGKEWETLLFQTYAQTYFNFLGHPPILPRVFG
ncbi:hypothetical protein E1B28_006908 [Marasmius oreades]|uniref:Uncharacterized protein n=1 Tax=Marasmius oreades TaxID=181124 RepID=A0A9P7S0R5_9AGAR|nr:uncharacterized protein E1B28_006908 [Marasmius oreades]KAG7093222.1 hypothetical protein E1B28_006908 [Marasmius oreades]